MMFNRCEVVAVDHGLLEAASSAAFAPPMEEHRRVETRIVSSPGDPTAAPITTRRPRGNAVVNMNVNAQTPPVPPAPPMVHERTTTSNGTPVSQDELDDLLKNAEKSLKKARESLRRAEEIQKTQDGNGGASEDPPNPDDE